jgi:phenylpropionate dioxygenase-like ring-hydroxylating dioxygenase large terminal subunit
LVFVNLDDEANPLAPDLAALEPQIAPLGLADHSVIHIEDLELACNWKILVENFCESYHVFAVHKDTLEAPTPTASTENREGGAGFNHHIQRNSTPLPPGLEAKLDLPQDKAD